MSNASFQMNGVEVFAENAQTVTVKNINVDANDTTTPSMCKAWVNFNGTLDENSGSLTVGENVLIRASYNVSSVYYNGTGNYTVNFANAMPDAHYVVTGFGSAGATQSVRTPTIVVGDTKSTTQLQIKYQRNDGALSDQENCFLTIFR